VSTFGFNENDAKRIGRAVRAVERLPAVIELGGPNREGATPGVRMMVGTVDGFAWNKNATKLVNIYSGPHPSTVEAGTVIAYNYFARLETSQSTARWVAVSNSGFGWVLIAAECDADDEE
jgi:hypothetical protein